MPETTILLGVIGRPHGVRGLVHVTSHTADKAALADYGPLSDGKGRRFTLAWRGEGIAELAELGDSAPTRVADRDAAARLTNTRLYIERARLPAPDDDEFYLADLIGLDAVDASGVARGRVVVSPPDEVEVGGDEGHEPLPSIGQAGSSSHGAAAPGQAQP